MELLFIGHSLKSRLARMYVIQSVECCKSCSLAMSSEACISMSLVLVTEEKELMDRLLDVSSCVQGFCKKEALPPSDLLFRNPIRCSTSISAASAPAPA